MDARIQPPARDEGMPRAVAGLKHELRQRNRLRQRKWRIRQQRIRRSCVVTPLQDQWAPLLERGPLSSGVSSGRQTWSGPRALVPGLDGPRGSGAGWLRGIR